MPRLLSLAILAGFVAFAHAPSIAQPDNPESNTVQSDDDVLAPIHQLFDGMRAGDSTAVRAAFDPIARLVRTSNRDGVPSYRIMPVNDFVNAVGTPHDAVWDEQIWDIKTEFRDNLASVWMKFAFFLGEEFSHCGVNSAELVNTISGWKIMHLSDTAQREGCEMPPEEG
jgi:hypothetical protein